MEVVLQYFWPVLQTALWVWLIWFLFSNLRQHLYALLEALKGRLADGSDLKFGSVEILNRAVTQSVEEQAAKLDAELSETSQTKENDTQSIADPAKERVIDIRSRYVLAEDLALRAMQIKYGEPINRQLTWGKDSGFDGAFVKDGCLHVIEVKYIPFGNGMRSLRDAVMKVSGGLQDYMWKNVRIVLVAVYENESSIPKELFEFDTIYKVEPHFYSINGLKAKFGVQEER